jgi:hypothetical protein
VPLFRDEPGQAGRCATCGPSEATPLPDDPQADEIAKKMIATLIGLADGRNSMLSKSGIPWERHAAMMAAWRAAGSPKRTDSGWDAWCVTRDELRLRLGSQRAFRPPTSSPQDSVQRRPR